MLNNRKTQRGKPKSSLSRRLLVKEKVVGKLKNNLIRPRIMLEKQLDKKEQGWGLANKSKNKEGGRLVSNIGNLPSSKQNKGDKGDRNLRPRDSKYRNKLDRRPQDLA